MAHKHGVLCFEMEAAGVINTVDHLVIRGSCDYYDTQKNDVWQKYAKLILSVVARVKDANIIIKRGCEEPLTKRRRVWSKELTIDFAWRIILRS